MQKRLFLYYVEFQFALVDFTVILSINKDKKVKFYCLSFIKITLNNMIKNKNKLFFSIK